MMKFFYNKMYIICFIVFLSFSVFYSISHSLNNVVEFYSEPVAVMCPLSEKYKEWEALPEEERNKIPMPPLCDSSAYARDSYFEGMETILDSPTDVKTAYPTYFDGRTKSYIKPVKNQQSTGGCWAFSTTTSLSMFMQKKYNVSATYSTRHMEYAITREFTDGINENGYNRVPGQGANYHMVGNYLANGYGPIAESQWPFENNEDKISIVNLKNKDVLLDVNDIVLDYAMTSGVCTAQDRENIKKYITENGSAVITTLMLTNSTYYNYSTDAYYYDDPKYAINHAVTIVGWDDNYSTDNFALVKPSNKGAWIVQNSYGTNWGDGGYYYLSYDDVNACDFIMSFNSVDTEIEDNIYSYDKLGYNTFLGFAVTDVNGKQQNMNTGYMMNIFSKEKGVIEDLKEITFGTNGVGDYTIYYTLGDGSDLEVSEMEILSTGKINHPGYVTYKLDKPLRLGKDVTEFSIVVYYDMDDTSQVLPVSAARTEKYKYVTLNKGKGFISSTGKSWQDSTGLYEHVVVPSIKAFTDDVEYYINFSEPDVSYDPDVYLDIDVDSYKIDDTKLSYVAKDSSGNEVTVKNFVHLLDNNSELNRISVSFNSELVNGEYTLEIYYKKVKIKTLVFYVARNMAIKDNIYKMDKTEKMIYVSPGTTIPTFISNLINSTGTVKKDGTVTRTGILMTGMTVDGYTIVVKGDVTGDGLVKINDAVTICRYIIEKIGLDSLVLKRAADVTGDGDIKINDAVTVCRHFIEGVKL